MPTKLDAVRFAADTKTSPAQLRHACEILGLSGEGEREVLRARLLAYLNPLEATDPVVCLNPRLEPDLEHKTSQSPVK